MVHGASEVMAQLMRLLACTWACMQIASGAHPADMEGGASEVIRAHAVGMEGGASEASGAIKIKQGQPAGAKDTHPHKKAPPRKKSRQHKEEPST